MKTYAEFQRTRQRDLIKYCPECGSVIKIVKRTDEHDTESGELLGYHLTGRCTSNPFKCEWRMLGARWWGYVGVDAEKEHSNAA